MTKIEAVGLSLVHFFWQGGLLLLLAWGLLFALRKRSAQARYLVCCLVLFAMVLAPFVTAYVLWPAAPLEPLRLTDLTTPVTNLPPVTVEAVPQSFSPETLRLVVLGWLIGVAVLTVRCLGGFLSLARLRRSGRSAVPDEVYARFVALSERMGIRRLPRIYISARVAVPTVIGAFRGMILLPASALTGMTPDMLETLLAHELAHVARFDFLVNAVQSLVEIVLFYHPAVWWLSNRIREERENCCDDLVLATLDDRKTYALALARVEELRLNPLALRANGGELLVRIRRILGEKQMKAIASPLSVAVLLGTLILVPAYQALAAVPDGADTKPVVHHVKKKKKHTTSKAHVGTKIVDRQDKVIRLTPSSPPVQVRDKEIRLAMPPLSPSPSVNPVSGTPYADPRGESRPRMKMAAGAPRTPSADVPAQAIPSPNYTSHDLVQVKVADAQLPGETVKPGPMANSTAQAKPVDITLVDQIQDDIKNCMSERAELSKRYHDADLKQVEAEIDIEHAKSSLENSTSDNDRDLLTKALRVATADFNAIKRSKDVLKSHIAEIDLELAGLRTKLDQTINK